MDSINSILDLVFDFVFFGAVFFGIFKLVQFSNKTFKVVKHTNVRFSDIAGMTAIKEEMVQLVEILKNPKAYSKSGIRQVKGVILEGLPGNGKTLFAKALAQESGVKFIATKGADFQGAVMSLSAVKVKMLFKKAKRNRPCIIFIDEFDSIGEKRNYAGTGIDKENNRMLTTLLNEMDGFESSSGILVIAATNSYQSLDSALIRPGRFDIKYTIGNPDALTRSELIDIYSKNKQFTDDITKELLIGATDGLSCSGIETLLNEAASLALMAKLDKINAGCLLAAAEKTGQRLKVKVNKR